jgi:hypothetical protein
VVDDEDLARKLQEEEDHKIAQALAKDPKLRIEDLVKSGSLAGRQDKMSGVSFQRQRPTPAFQAPQRVTDETLSRVQAQLLDPNLALVVFRPEDDGWESVRAKVANRPAITAGSMEERETSTALVLASSVKKTNVMADLETLEQWANTPGSSRTERPKVDSRSAVDKAFDSLEPTKQPRVPPPRIVDLQKSLPPALIPEPTAGYGSDVFVPTTRKPAPPPPAFAPTQNAYAPVVQSTSTSMVVRRAAPPPAPMMQPPAYTSNNTGAMVPFRRPAPQPVPGGGVPMNQLPPRPQAVNPMFQGSQSFRPTVSTSSSALVPFNAGPARRPAPAAPMANPYRPFDNVQRANPFGATQPPPVPMRTFHSPQAAAFQSAVSSPFGMQQQQYTMFTGTTVQQTFVQQPTVVRTFVQQPPQQFSYYQQQQPPRWS